MACTYHSTLTRLADTTADASPITFDVTVPSGLTNPGMLIFVIYERDTSQDVTAVTVEGVSATFIAGNLNATGATEERIEAWVIASPTTGAGVTISLTTGDSGNDIVVFVIMVEGMDQTTMYGASTTADDKVGSDEELSATLNTTAADSCVLAAVSCTQFEKGPVTALTGAGVTQADEVAIGDTTAGIAAWAGYVNATTVAGYTIGATFTNTGATDVMRLLAVELLAATGGGPTYTSRLALLGAG